MSDSSEKQTSAEVAHEAEDVRAGLAHTLEQLRENLKPEHVIQEVVSNARFGATSLADGLYDLARKHPLPALMIGAGCAMVLGLGAKAGPGSGTGLHTTRNHVGRAAAIRDGRRDPAWSRPEPLSNTQAQSTQLWSPYRRNARDTADPGQSRVSLSTEDMMDRSMAGLGPKGGNTTSRLSGILHEQPLIVAALGLAVGAAIGAALPATEVEDDFMGGTSSSVKNAAKEAAQSELEGLKAVASRTADNLKQSAADHGLSAENLNGLVKDAGEHAKAAIRDVAPAGGQANPA